MISAVRNTCFALLSAIEFDLREFIGDVGLSIGSLELLLLTSDKLRLNGSISTTRTTGRFASQ